MPRSPEVAAVARRLLAEQAQFEAEVARRREQQRQQPRPRSSLPGTRLRRPAPSRETGVYVVVRDSLLYHWHAKNKGVYMSPQQVCQTLNTLAPALLLQL